MNIKVSKYIIFSCLPGQFGQIYLPKLHRVIAQHCFKYALKQCKGKTHIDIGANRGEYTMIMSNFADHVYAYEPDPFAHDLLTTTTSGLSNVTIMQYAVGAENKSVNLYRAKEFLTDPRENTIKSSIYLSQELDETSYITVDQISVLDLLDNLNKDIGVIKIDAEGSEVPILECLLDSNHIEKIDYIFVETHERLFPEMINRYREIFKKVNYINKPKINMNWH